MPTVAQPSNSAQIKGLTHPYHGGVASSYVYAQGYTFRWVRGDRYVAVMRGTCVDGRRVFIVRDTLAGHTVLENSQPLIDVIPVPVEGWWSVGLLGQVAKRWAATRISGSGT